MHHFLPRSFNLSCFRFGTLLYAQDSNLHVFLLVQCINIMHCLQFSLYMECMLVRISSTYNEMPYIGIHFLYTHDWLIPNRLWCAILVTNLLLKKHTRWTADKCIINQKERIWEENQCNLIIKRSPFHCFKIFHHKTALEISSTNSTLKHLYFQVIKWHRLCDIWLWTPTFWKYHPILNNQLKVLANSSNNQSIIFNAFILFWLTRERYITCIGLHFNCYVNSCLYMQ